MWKKVQAGFSAFTATTRDTFGCTGNNGDAIDDDDDNNYVADTNSGGSSSHPGFVEIDFLRSDLNHHRKFPDNSIRTAKYTLLSGLPLSLLYQFYKISNFYFLLVMVLSLVPGASPINPFSSVVPLCIVLGAGIIKDLWEDWKRRKADQQANQMIVHVLRVPMQPDGSIPAPAPPPPTASAATPNIADDSLERSGGDATKNAEKTTRRASTGSEVTATPITTTDNTASKQNNKKNSSNSNINNTTSDSDERNNESAATVVVDGGGGGPAASTAVKDEVPSKDRKRKRVVHFLFPSDKSKIKNSSQVAVNSNSSPDRNVEMASFDQPPQNKDTGADQAAAAAAAAPAVPPSLLVKHDHPKKVHKEKRADAPTHAAAAADTAVPADTASTLSQEPRVTFQPVRSCDVYPGDIMLFRLGEEVKADCIILNTSLPDGLTYIETANLDGETNAKTRRAKIQTVEALGTVEDIIERSLGVPANNAAAVFARMNGLDGANSNLGGASGGLGEPPSKVSMDCCGAVGAHVVTSPEEEANNALAAAAAATNNNNNAALSVVVVSSAPESPLRHVTPHGPAQSAEEKKRLLSAVTSSTSETAGSPTEEHGPQTRAANVPADAAGSALRDGEDAHAFVAGHLEREEREAAAEDNAHGGAAHHRRSFSDSLLQQQQQNLYTTGSNSHYPRSTLPLVMSGADLAPANSEPLFAFVDTFGGSANNTPGDISLERVLHQRHLTLDERLMEEGALPVPQHLRELSAQYDRAVHSRTNSLGAHRSVSTWGRRTDTNVLDDVESVCVEGGSGHRGHARTTSAGAASRVDSSLRLRSNTTNNIASTADRSRAGTSARATVRNSDGLSAGGGVTPAEEGGGDELARFAASNELRQGEGAAAAAANGNGGAVDGSSGVVLVSCAPTPDLSMWYGQLRMPSGEMVPLGIDQFIPRGCLIRNTDWVLGAVVYTGRHTKMLLNLRPKPNKITNMTRRLNQLNVFLFLLNQALMFLMCGLSIWSKHYMLRQVPGTRSDYSAWYIQWNLNRYADATLFWWRYLTNFVLLSYLIPMSLYVTLEFNKAMQMLMIGADKRMAVYDEFTGAIKKARPKTSELNCQLGHVRYIFTDKTGTLTENLMTYVGGVVDGHTHSETEQPGGIGRALLKRRGGGGRDGRDQSNTFYNTNNSSGNIAGMARRLLSLGSGVLNNDELHGVASGISGWGNNTLENSFTAAMNDSLNLVPPPPQQQQRRSLLIPAMARNHSTMPADGGEAPTSATGPDDHAAVFGGSTSLNVSATAMPAGLTYQMPAALASLPAPTPLQQQQDGVIAGSGVPPPLSGATRPILTSRGGTAAAHRRTASADSAVHFADQPLHHSTSMPVFATPGTPGHPEHARIGSGVGLPQPHPMYIHQSVHSGSANQWCSGTFNGGGNFSSSAFPAMNATSASNGGACGVGLGSVSEAVLERDPLFRYLRALALCHSIVCFPIHGPDSVASETSEQDMQGRSVDEAVVEDTDGHAAAKAERKRARKERHRQRREEKRRRRGEAAVAGTAPLSREEREGAAAADTQSKKSQRRAERRAARAEAHARHGSTTGLPPVSSLLSLSDISGANFVEIPYAVPAGPPRDTFEPYSSHHQRTNTTTDVTGTETHGHHRHHHHHRSGNEPVTSTSSGAYAARSLHALSASGTSPINTPAQPALPAAATPHATDGGGHGGGAVHRGTSSVNKLHGRTSSASWYQNRYFNRVMHSRNFSQNSNLNSTRRSATNGGGQASPRSPTVNSRILRNGMSMSGVDGGAGGAGGALGGIEQFIDRTKIYEGQSLDEIALVNAARENGFSLFERTAKQMYVKALGRVMCYDIIAELEFTPQRKLMSILLQRRPDLDSEGAATSAAAGTSSHYHRKSAEARAADQQAANEAAASLLHSMNAGAAAMNASGTFQSIPLHGFSDHEVAAPSRVQHQPFTPDMLALAASLNDAERTNGRSLGPGGASSSPFASAANTPHAALRRQAGPVASPPPPLPRPGSQAEEAHRGVYHAHSSSVFTPPPSAGLQLLSSINGGSAPRPHASAAAYGSGGGGEDKKYLLLVKGADSSMMEIVNMQKKANARVKEKMLAELDAMAKLGLRTLVLGQRHLSEEEVLAWLPVYNEAQCSMQDRNEKLHEAYALLEKDVDIVGTTAVEDKLQDEVPQTLEFCIQASIVVWMLTGDKRETAVTIAHTSGLVSAEYTDYVCHLDVSDIIEEEALLKQQKQYEARAREKKAKGELNNDDDDEEEDEDDKGSSDSVSVSPSPTAEQVSQPSGSKSMEVSSATQPLPGLSSGTHSPGPQSARTVAGEAEAAAMAAGLRKTDAAVLEGGTSDGTTTAARAKPTASPAATTAESGTPEAFLARKLARIEQQLAAAEEKCSEGEEVFGTHTVVVVVDGKTLDFIFQDNARAHRFFLLGSRCRSAVCCRMTPLQKAKIVRMFKRNMNAVALAIGDGANDVSMIQESSIGVGIMGLEGSQAELASDYAIPKFRFLKRLLFVHGRFSVFREAHCIVYSLYKNVIVTVGMITYQFYACYSGQSLMDSWLLAMFSIFFCSLQPLMIGILDKDVEDELAESLPKLYPPLSREFMYFSFPYIMKWLFDGLVEGIFFFFVLMYTVGVQDNLYPHMTPAIEDYGTTFFTMLVLVADFRVATLVTYYMILFALAVTVEIIAVPVIELVYSAMNNLAGSNWCVKVANELYGTSGKFWIMLFFACGVLVVVTMASNMYIQLFSPWQNAGFAMRAAKASSHRVPYERMKRELKEEYARLLARYEELRRQQEMGELKDVDENGRSASTVGSPLSRAGSPSSPLRHPKKAFALPSR